MTDGSSLPGGPLPGGESMAGLRDEDRPLWQYAADLITLAFCAGKAAERSLRQPDDPDLRQAAESWCRQVICAPFSAWRKPEAARQLTAAFLAGAGWQRTASGPAAAEEAVRAAERQRIFRQAMTCQECGEIHEQTAVPAGWTRAALDGHRYRPLVSEEWRPLLARLLRM